MTNNSALNEKKDKPTVLGFVSRVFEISIGVISTIMLLLIAFFVSDSIMTEVCPCIYYNLGCGHYDGICQFSWIISLIMFLLFCGIEIVILSVVGDIIEERESQ